VSPRTVSNVVRDYVHVAPDTRRRVLSAIEELKYRPNASARSLRRGRTGIIALAVPEIAAPYFAELADLVQRAAGERGVTLLVDQTGGSRDREALVLDGYHTGVIDGLLLSPMSITADDLAEQALQIPTVLLGERVGEGTGLLHVGIDNVAAARSATTHLLERGRRRVAAVGADSTENLGPASRRLQGYRLALAEAGLPAAPELEIETGSWGHASGYAAVTTLLRGGAPVDGLFCFNDVLALAAVRAVHDAGLHVPDDVAVVGWDDIAVAAYATPTLTTVRPDKAAIARTSVDRLLALVAGERTGEEEVVCGWDLAVRGTSGG
jgi:DNA-binding LacI/PurR family transcriptional regulator